MKFIMGCITGWIIFILALVGFYFYFDVDSYSTIKTNELEKLQQQQQQQQPTEQKHNGITPPNMKEKTSKEIEESHQRKSEIQALQENDKAQDWKEEYNELNEGTDEKPYVTINGRKVDPKHVTGKENN